MENVETVALLIPLNFTIHTQAYKKRIKHKTNYAINDYAIHRYAK